jgi:hypothetical protein
VEQEKGTMWKKYKEERKGKLEDKMVEYTHNGQIALFGEGVNTVLTERGEGSDWYIYSIQ